MKDRQSRVAATCATCPNPVEHAEGKTPMRVCGTCFGKLVDDVWRAFGWDRA